MFWHFGKFKLNQTTNGFSILELLVVISIFLVITGVVMTNIPSFRNKSSLDLIASEVATYIRGAQVYGTTQRGSEIGVGNVSYGLNFVANSADFYLFKNEDVSNNIVESYNIQGFQIKELKIFKNDGQVRQPDSVQVVFRANNYISSIGTQLEPEIYVDGDSQSFVYFNVKIVPDRDPSLSRCVRVYNNGQIALAGCDN